MKKFIFALAIASMMTSVASAQTSSFDDQDQISALRSEVGRERDQYDTQKYWEAVNRTWGHSRYKNIAYVMQDLEFKDSGLTLEKDWGVGLEIGNSYFLSKKPIAGFMEFSIDVDWLDLSYARYKSADTKAFATSRVEAEDILGDTNQQITAGMGLGLGFHIAPFAKMGSAMQPFRVSAHGRFIPSYSGIMYKQGGDTKIHGAFLPVFAYGVSVDYKAIGFGVQMRTGQADYKDFVANIKDEYLGTSTSDIKSKIKTSSTRLYISFHF